MSIQNKFGLSSRDMSTIFSILEKYPDVQEVYVYGSRAKGNFRSGSDIDLAIMNNNLSTNTILQLNEDFEESSLPYFVEIVNFNELKNPEFVDHIKRVAQPFYKQGEEISI